jgi:hypothetical protein
VLRRGRQLDTNFDNRVKFQVKIRIYERTAQTQVLQAAVDSRNRSGRHLNRYTYSHTFAPAVLEIVWKRVMINLVAAPRFPYLKARMAGNERNCRAQCSSSIDSNDWHSTEFTGSLK